MEIEPNADGEDLANISTASTVVIDPQLINAVQAFYDEFLDRQPDQQEIDDMGHYIVRQPNVIDEAVEQARHRRVTHAECEDRYRRELDRADEAVERARGRVRELESYVRIIKEREMDARDRVKRLEEQRRLAHEDYSIMKSSRIEAISILKEQKEANAKLRGELFLIKEAKKKEDTDEDPVILAAAGPAFGEAKHADMMPHEVRGLIAASQGDGSSEGDSDVGECEEANLKKGKPKN